MRSRKILAFLAAVGGFTLPVVLPAFAAQFNPTYGPSPSNLYWDFGCTTGSLVADWPLTGSGGSAGTTFADASGNGNTATLYGTDTLTSTTALGYPAAPVGGGIYFNGLSGAGNYLGVPYNAAFSGMDNITLTAWVYFPSGFTVNDETAAGKREIFSLWNQSGGNQCYQLGFVPNTGSTSWLAFEAPDDSFDTHYWNTGGTPPGPHATPGSWQLISVSYAGGTGGPTAVGMWNLMENGIENFGGQLNVAVGNAPDPIPTAAANQVLKLAGGDNEWIGGLADLAIWSSALSATDSTGPTTYIPTTGLSAGQLGALYNTPMSGIFGLGRVQRRGDEPVVQRLCERLADGDDSGCHRQRHARLAVRGQRIAGRLGQRGHAYRRGVLRQSGRFRRRRGNGRPCPNRPPSRSCSPVPPACWATLGDGEQRRATKPTK